jgi:hypothetical protein
VWCWYVSAKDGSFVNYSLVNQVAAKDLVVYLFTFITVRCSQWGDSSCAARHSDTRLYSFPKSHVFRPNCTSVICTCWGEIICSCFGLVIYIDRIIKLKFMHSESVPFV